MLVENKRLDAGCREVKEGWKSLPKQFLFLPSVKGLLPLGLPPHSYTCTSQTESTNWLYWIVYVLVKCFYRFICITSTKVYSVKLHTRGLCVNLQSSITSLQLPFIQKQPVATKASKIYWYRQETGLKTWTATNFAFCWHAHIFSIHYDKGQYTACIPPFTLHFHSRPLNWDALCWFTKRTCICWQSQKRKVPPSFPIIFLSLKLLNGS